ncbi:unnamed protein product [Urochloa humidicola]
MDADSSAVLAAGRQRSGGGGGGDRLSRLDDGALGHILSFLPATEAARATALSRRWRHIFAAVHTLSFREAEWQLSMRGYRWFQHCDYCHPGDPNNVRAPRFVTGVGAALHGRDRGPHAGGGGAAPLRALRVAFDEFGFRGGDARNAVDGWLMYAKYHAGDHLEIDLRLDAAVPVCERKYTLLPHVANVKDDGGEPNTRPAEYVVPRSLFSCAALRTLRLGGCCLSLPSAITLPSLVTLHLTLEACRDLTEIAVPEEVRLRRLALRCCHELTLVTIDDSSELQAFDYCSAVPNLYLLSVKQLQELSSCTLDICGQEPAEPLDLTFLLWFATVESMHLTSARLGRGIFNHGMKYPSFPNLRNLELTGMLPEDDTAVVAAMTMILERTPSLETLSLFFLPEPHPVVTSHHFNDHVREEVIHAVHKLRYDQHTALTVPATDIPCLRRKTREINFVHYQGAMAQRMLAKFLLRNAPVVDEVCCEFARGPLPIQTELMEEMKGWVLNKSANMMFL